MRQDPVTGSLQTDEQAAAADASAKEGFFARFEGRLNQIHGRISEREKVAAEEKARVDALEQKQKQVEQGALDKVVEHFQSREANLILRHDELEAEHDLLQKNFDALLARLNGQVPGFYEALGRPVLNPGQVVTPFSTNRTDEYGAASRPGYDPSGVVLGRETGYDAAPGVPGSPGGAPNPPGSEAERRAQQERDRAPHSEQAGQERDRPEAERLEAERQGRAHAAQPGPQPDPQRLVREPEANRPGRVRQEQQQAEAERKAREAREREQGDGA